MATRANPTIVGVIGHHGHGKTTLAVALLQRAMARGGAVVCPPATHSFGTVEHCTHPLWYRCASPHSELLLVDCPHLRADWLASVLPTLDAAILVVAAHRGIEGRIRELLLLARQAGLQWLAVFLNHTDLGPVEIGDELELDVRRMLHGLDLPGDDVPVIRGDALAALVAPECDTDTLRPIDELLFALASIRPRRGDEAAPFLMPGGRARARTQEEPFEGTDDWEANHRLPVHEQRCVLIGRVVQGTVRVGNEVAVLQNGLDPVRLLVRQIRSFDQGFNEARSGDAVGLCLAAGPRFAGEQLPWLAAGDIVAAPGHFHLNRQFRARLTVYEGDEITNGSMHSESSVSFWIGTTHSKGKIVFGSGGTLHAGCSDEVTVLLNRGTVLTAGQAFACRHHKGALGYGQVLNVLG